MIPDGLLDLGTILLGGEGEAAALDILNAVFGPADALSVESLFVLSGGGAFGLTFDGFDNLAPGSTDADAFGVTWTPTAVGNFQEEIEFVGTGANASGYNDGANVLDPTLTITGWVVGASAAGTAIPEPASWPVLMSALGGLGALRRARWSPRQWWTRRARAARAGMHRRGQARGRHCASGSSGVNIAIAEDFRRSWSGIGGNPQAPARCGYWTARISSPRSPALG